MSDIGVSKPLAKAIIARQETQRHLECPNRQITSRAKRQATTVKVRSRARRRSGPRICHHEFVDRLTFERWVELDVIACSLAMQEQLIGELRYRDDVPVHHLAAQADPKQSCRCWTCPSSMFVGMGLGHGSSLPAGDKYRAGVGPPFLFAAV